MNWIEIANWVLLVWVIYLEIRVGVIKIDRSTYKSKAADLKESLNREYKEWNDAYDHIFKLLGKAGYKQYELDDFYNSSSLEELADHLLAKVAVAQRAEAPGLCRESQGSSPCGGSSSMLSGEQVTSLFIPMLLDAGRVTDAS